MLGLKAVEFLEELKEGKEAYDWERIRRLVEEFMPSFVQHLSDEIQTIEALDRYGGEGKGRTLTVLDGTCRERNGLSYQREAMAWGRIDIALP